MEFRRFVAAGGLVVGLVGAWPASAVLPPQAYLQARASAGVHLQVQVSRVRTSPKDSTCRMEGRALAVWRGPVKTGAKVRFTLPCRFASTPVMPGPTLWFDPSGLKPGQVLEGFFESGEGGLRPARDQVFRVRAASAEPRCGTGDYACKDESAAP
jgi:hypothetical protein